jgi:hypothetical protein
VLQAARLTLVQDIRPRGFASPPHDGFALFSSPTRIFSIDKIRVVFKRFCPIQDLCHRSLGRQMSNLEKVEGGPGGAPFIGCSLYFWS